MSSQKTTLGRRALLALVGAGTAAVAAGTRPAAARPTRTAVVTDFGADPTGTEHAAAAFQAAIDSLPSHGGTVIVPPGTYVLAGQVVELRSHVDIVGTDATIVRRVREGSYAAFVGLSHGVQGRRTGVTDVTIRGLTFRGTFAESGSSATICVLALHHCADIRVENCEFIQCQGGAGHTFDLCGCDDITFSDCTWRGYRTSEDLAPTAETIQLDISHSSTVSYPDDAGSYDALATRNVTIERCRFLPLEINGVTWPAPNPVGSHFEQEGQPYSGLVMRDVEIVDPAADLRPAENGDNVRPPRGIIHVPQLQDSLFENVTVRSTTRQVSNRVMMFTSNSWGRLISDANVPGSRGYYETPVTCSNITIRNLVVEGFAVNSDEDPAQNPIIWISGVDGGSAENICIDATIRDGGATALMIGKAVDVKIKVHVESYRCGVDLTACQDVRIAGSAFTDVDVPVRLFAVDGFAVVGTRGEHAETQPAAVTLDDISDHGLIAGTRWRGYTDVVVGGGSEVVVRGSCTST